MKHFFYAAALFFSIIFISCLDSIEGFKDNTKGSVTFGTSNRSISIGGSYTKDDIAEISVTLTKGADIVTGKGKTSVTIDNLEPGVYKAEISAYTSDKSLAAYGTEESVSVAAGETTEVSVDMILRMDTIFAVAKSESTALTKDSQIYYIDAPVINKEFAANFQDLSETVSITGTESFDSAGKKSVTTTLSYKSTDNKIYSILSKKFYELAAGKHFEATFDIIADKDTYFTSNFSGSNVYKIYNDWKSVTIKGNIEEDIISPLIICPSEKSIEVSIKNFSVTITDTPVESIVINSDIKELEIGKPYQLSVSFNPPSAMDKTVTWTSSDEKIATISSDGIVTCNAEGKVNITATSSNGKTSTITFEIKENNNSGTIEPVEPEEQKVEVTSVIIESDSDTIELKQENVIRLTARVLPDNATDKTITWKSSDTSIATVSNTGLVTAIKEGTVSITASSTNNKSETVSVTVKKPAVNDIPVENIRILSESGATEINIGETYQLSVTLSPENATNKTVIWSSSNDLIATVDNTGLVTAIKDGTVSITAMSSNGKISVVEFTVKKLNTPVVETEIPVTEISVKSDKTELTAGETYQLSVTVSPDNASDKTITWKSSDTNVATVDSTGLVTAIKGGTVSVTAMSSNEKISTVEFTVKTPVESLEIITPNSVNEVYTESTIQLGLIFTPEDASDKTVIWESSDTSIATVSNTGLVTASGVGNVTITATTSNGIKAEHKFEIKIPSESIEINGPEEIRYSDSVPSSYHLSAEVLPANATSKDIIWISSNTDIASIDDDGKLTIHSVSQTEIVKFTARCRDGFSEASYEVKIIPTGTVDIIVDFK